MRFRIYADESGTHDERWLVIGLLFVPNHGPLQSALCKIKEELKYFNTSPNRKARYRETHLTRFRSHRDVDVAKRWIGVFVQQNCYFRCVVVDWSVWDGRHFGGPFEPEALKKRRAYKKWAEMLLHAELKSPQSGAPIQHARFFLDRLRIMYGYNVLDHLRERFTERYRGEAPYIDEFNHTDSWRDANQCLQLCDVLTGCQYQALVPSDKEAKVTTRTYLESALRPFGVKRLNGEFWRQYAPNTLNNHFSKFSAWFWRPTNKKSPKNGKRRRR